MTRMVFAESSGSEPVGRAERGRVGQGRIAREELVVDPERLQCGDEAVAPGRDRGRRDRWARRATWSWREAYDAGRRRSGTRRPDTTARYHRDDDRSPTDDRAGHPPPRRSTSTPTSARFAWHPEPELIGFRDAATSRTAMERLGRGDLDRRARLPVRPSASSARWATRRRTRWRVSATTPPTPAGASRWPRPGPGRPDAGRRRARRVLRPARRRADEQPAPTTVRLLHAAAAADVDRGRAPRPDGQPGRRRLARRAVRRLRRGGGRPLAVRPRRLRRAVVRGADQRRRDGQLHGDGAGPRPAASAGCAASTGHRAGATSRTPGSTPATRRTTPIARALDELGFPAVDARGRARATTRSTCAARRSPRPSRATAPPA